jgi:hypothetical protein
MEDGAVPAWRDPFREVRRSSADKTGSRVQPGNWLITTTDATTGLAFGRFSNFAGSAAGWRGMDGKNLASSEPVQRGVSQMTQQICHGEQSRCCRVREFLHRTSLFRSSDMRISVMIRPTFAPVWKQAITLAFFYRSRRPRCAAAGQR